MRSLMHPYIYVLMTSNLHRMEPLLLFNQFRQRELLVPLPKFPNSSFCLSTALLSVSMGNTLMGVTVFRYTLAGASHVPLTQKNFIDHLLSCLAAMAITLSDYSGHSFRHGGYFCFAMWAAIRYYQNTRGLE